jgi:plastocyanin
LIQPWEAERTLAAAKLSREDRKHFKEKQKMNRSSIISIAVVVLVLLGVSVMLLGRDQSKSSNGQAAGHEVSIDNFSFTPETLTVPAGTEVKWINHDDVPHTVVSTDQRFKSKALDTDESFSFTFTQPGTYEYFCSVHPKMTAKVIVQ